MKSLRFSLRYLFVFLCIIAPLVFTDCSTPLDVSGKALTIHKFGIEQSDVNNAAPGKSVTLFALANKLTGVGYTWELPGTWKKLTDNRVSWTIPEIPGVYELKVTAMDTDGRTAERTEKVTVTDKTAELMSGNFSCRIKCSTSMNCKEGGESNEYTFDITKTDEKTLVTFNDGTAQTSFVFEDGNYYLLDENGNKACLAQNAPVPDMTFSSSVSMSQLETAFGAKTDVGGNKWAFEKSVNGSYTKVIFDSTINRVISMYVKNATNGSVTENTMTYKNVNGYIQIDKIQSTMRSSAASTDDTVMTTTLDFADFQAL